MYTVPANQTTFSFGGVSVTDIVENILIPDIRRPARTAVQKRKLTIPGRDGSWDFGPGEKRDFNIEVDFTITSPSSTQTRQKLRDLDAFLDGKKELFFTDDEEQGYQAAVYAQILLNKRVFSHTQSGTIVFECDADILYKLRILAYDTVSTDALPGVDIEIHTGYPIIEIGDPVREGSSDSEGYFYTFLKPGSYTVIGSLSGYVLKEKEIVMTETAKLNAWIGLTPE